MRRSLALVSIIAICGLAAGGCCKSLQCAAHRSAERQLSCSKVELTDVTDKLRSEGRDLPKDRRIQQAKGCGRKAKLECALITSGVVHRESQLTHEPTSDVPAAFADPQWRCWELPDRPRQETGATP